jgi:hypothetical protein
MNPPTDYEKRAARAHAALEALRSELADLARAGDPDADTAAVLAAKAVDTVDVLMGALEAVVPPVVVPA